MPKKQAAKRAEDTVNDRMVSRELGRTLFIQEFKRKLVDDELDRQIIDLATMSLNKVLDSVNTKAGFNNSIYKIHDYITKELQVFDINSKDLNKISKAAMATWSEIYDC